MIPQFLLACALSLAAVSAQSVAISHVRHNPQSFDPARGESAQVSFRVAGDAFITLRIYDGRELQIREVKLGRSAAGDLRVTWDGRDDLGRLVPSEAYTYALVAKKDSREATVWDLAESTGGDRIPVHDVRWEAQAGHIAYRIDQPSRVRIRIGLQNDGPLLRTLIDWVPRAAGLHQEPWDGTDSAGVFDLAAHTKLALRAEAFALPRNTLLVTPPPTQVVLIEGLPADAPRREPQTTRRHRMFAFARQPIERRRDFEVSLVPVGELRRTSDGVPIVEGSLVVQLRAGSDDLAAILSERCEAVFFVDGQHVFEREIGFLPMTWTWTPTATSPGTHYITANLRGYEGHFGMTTLRVVIEAEGHE